MKQKPPLPEEKGECAPLWIISFADMISLLMAFFVMLLTMAAGRSGKLCNEGEGIFEETLYGFRRSIATFGLPGLFGAADEAVEFDSPKVYYPMRGEDDVGVTRTLAAGEERLRRIFQQLGRHARTYTSPVQGCRPDFLVAPIKFAQGESTLDGPGKQFLSTFAADLQAYAPLEKLHLYVVGLAPESAGAKGRWVLSARRAQAVADGLRALLPPDTDCRVFSWGAAGGGDWVRSDGPVSRQSHIAIAILRPGE